MSVFRRFEFLRKEQVTLRQLHKHRDYDSGHATLHLFQGHTRDPVPSTLQIPGLLRLLKLQPFQWFSDIHGNTYDYLFAFCFVFSSFRSWPASTYPWQSVLAFQFGSILIIYSRVDLRSIISYQIQLSQISFSPSLGRVPFTKVDFTLHRNFTFIGKKKV